MILLVKCEHLYKAKCKPAILMHGGLLAAFPPTTLANFIYPCPSLMCSNTAPGMKVEMTDAVWYSKPAPNHIFHTVNPFPYTTCH